MRKKIAIMRECYDHLGHALAWQTGKRVENAHHGPMGATAITSFEDQFGKKYELEEAMGGCTLYEIQ